ncbi:hypothetical protein Syun_002757 [Stephania yunnanensis]|uniref:CID domain-containing protein n=1 Tax=Stephania yunnanensis TaxID=152371 RepID=A0AAP0Q7F9_9MAGN
MTNDAFSGQLLAEKLSKLNNSQQSIETLSHWCIFHRKKAKQVVETWDQLFNNAQKEQRISFLYLANDILQNSRRKGSEFVNEFWKVLPACLKNVFENSDDGKKAVSRLVNIWEDRKVFGSRGQSLKDAMLGKDPLPQENNGKITNPIKIVRKDANSIRIKLAIGGLPEKIVTAFQSVHDEHFKEDTALSKCKAAVQHVEKIEKEFEIACSQDNQLVTPLGDELEEQESILRQCMEQLETAEAARKALIDHLKEALQDQESKLALVQTEKQIARSCIEHASRKSQRRDSSVVLVPAITSSLLMEMRVERSQPPNQTTSNNLQLPFSQPLTSYATPTTRDDDDKKAAAAAVAAKLAAMTSSAQMLSSVLSSLAAEEAAFMNGGLKPGNFTSLPMFSPEKRPKIDKPLSVSDMGNSTYFTHVQQQPLQTTQTPITSMQPLSHSNQVQPQYPPPPLPLPLPPLPLPPVPAQPYAQSNHMMGGSMPFGFAPTSLPPPPPPPLPSHMVMGLARPGAQPLPQQPQQLKQQQSQQQQATGGFYQSPGIGFYSQSPQKPTPPLPRQ